MKTSSNSVRAGVSLRYWFQTWAAICGNEERGGSVDDDVTLLDFEGVGVESGVEDGGWAARTGVVLFVLGVEPRTEPELVEEVGFFAMVGVCVRVGWNGMNRS
jgi:hypothetical protein